MEQQMRRNRICRMSRSSILSSLRRRIGEVTRFLQTESTSLDSSFAIRASFLMAKINNWVRWVSVESRKPSKCLQVRNKKRCMVRCCQWHKPIQGIPCKWFHQSMLSKPSISGYGSSLASFVLMCPATLHPCLQTIHFLNSFYYLILI